MNKQKEKYEKALQKINKKYEESSKEIKRILAAIDKYGEVEEGDSLETIVLKKYLVTGSVREVADYINNLGYRIKTETWAGQRKYSTNDITDIIDEANGCDQELKAVVQKTFGENYTVMMRRYG